MVHEPAPKGSGMRLDTNSGTSGETVAERPVRKRKRAAREGGDQSGSQRRRSRAQARANGNGTGRATGNGARKMAVPLQGATALEGDGLTPEQIRRLERRLLDERQRALRTLWAKRMDMEDHRSAGSLDEVELDIRMAERHSEFLSLIDDALHRLRESPDDFDVSVVSGARIPFERLDMVPWTRRLTEEVGHGYD